MKNVNYWQTGGLHRRQDRRVGQRAAQKGSVAGCEKGRVGLQKRAALRTALFRSPV